MPKLQIILFYFFTAFPLFSDYPLINFLESSDPLFKQISEDIELSYKITANSAEKLPLIIAKYKLKNENLFQIASRLNIPYETISTLNRIANPDNFSDFKEILIPNQPVLFIPEKPVADIEFILSAREHNTEKVKILINSRKNVFFILHDERFNNTERSFFLNTFFRFPIEKGRISSFYGNRLHPKTGKMSFHNGIDIAAQPGTPVYSSAAGSVIESSFNSVLGNYIVIEHPGGLLTIYGHLRKSLVLLNSYVRSGSIIGEVGNTGYSTGPHLHFEIRKKGESQDPLKYMQVKSR